MRTVDFDDIVALGQNGTNVLIEAKNLRKARAIFGEFIDYLVDGRVNCEIRMYDCRVTFPSGAFARFISESQRYYQSFDGEVFTV